MAKVSRHCIGQCIIQSEHFRCIELYQLAYASSVSITVSGVNHPFILCTPNNASLSVTANGNTLVEWEWKGLIFHGCTHPILHANFHSVVIHDCSLIMLTRVHVHNVSHVAISNSVFTQSFNDFCSTIIIVDDADERQFPITKNTRFIFINNVISNYTCYHDYTQYTEFVKITRYYYDNVTITNNIVENISFREHGHIKLFSFLSDFQRGSVVIRNNSFVHINYPDAVISFGNVNCNGEHFAEYTIELNNFSSIFVGTSIVEIFATEDSDGTKFYINHNRFINNERIALILFRFLNHVCLYPKAVSINGLTLINNTFDAQTPITILSLSITIQNVYAEQNYVQDKLHKAAIMILGFDKESCFFENVLIQVYNINFINNTVNSVIASSTLIAISGAQTAAMANVTFRNNFGTPISINSHRSKDRTSFVPGGTLLFNGNTGNHGGACSFYHVHIKNNAANMTFVDNFAIYGGALYIQDSQFATDKEISAAVNFWNNSAMTAGNNIFFNTHDLDSCMDCIFFQTTVDLVHLPTTLHFFLLIKTMDIFLFFLVKKLLSTFP